MSRLQRHVWEDQSDIALAKGVVPALRYFDACLTAAVRTDAAMARVITAWLRSPVPGSGQEKNDGCCIVIEFPAGRSRGASRLR